MGALFLALIPLAVMIIARMKYPRELTLPELAVGAVVSLFLGWGMYAVGVSSQTYDTELWNGEITDTDKDVSRYTEPYDCRCRTVTSGSGSNKTTRRVCDTCYRYGYNLRWDALSNIGSFRIQSNRCTTDSRTWCVARYPDPQRWLDIEIGDPVSRTNSYTNYIQASENSLFHRSASDNGAQSRAPDLEYPISVYDHYHVDRVLTDGVELPGGLRVWNDGLAEILKTVGPQKQANMVVVVTDAGNPSYADMLISEWEGANKNDIVIIAGFIPGNTASAPDWIKVHSWAKRDIMNITMRDELLDNPEWWQSADNFFPNVQAIVLEHFERRPMEEFEYLADQIRPSTGMMVFLSILGALAGVGLSVFFVAVDVFGGLQRGNGYRRFR